MGRAKEARFECGGNGRLNAVETGTVGEGAAQGEGCVVECGGWERFFLSLRLHVF